MLKKSLVALMVVGTLLVSACGGGSSGGSGGKGTVGIALPTRLVMRWLADGANLKKAFEAQGYTTEVQYGEDVVYNQVSQVENMITRNVKVLVIAAIDSKSLTGVLKKAADKKIPVIAYDRLIRDTRNVNYYASFDNFQVGVLQASYIEQKLELNSGKGPFNIELFAGSLDDNNTYFFFNGAMSVLQPYIDSGKLVVRSNQTKVEQVATRNWDSLAANARMDTLLTANYSLARVDAVLSPYDGISIGTIAALETAGYGTSKRPLPVVTGQDAELASVKSIIKGEQTQTVFKDTRELAKVTVKMADALVNSKPAEVNDIKSYDNGQKVVPAYLLPPVSVDKTNYKQVLLDSGYYTVGALGG